MEILIASNDQAIATKIRGCLQEHGFSCPLSQMVSVESAQLMAAAPRSDEPTLVFFGSRQLSTEDFALLSQLCASSSEGLKVVVVGPSFGAGAILQAVRSGAIDCLSLNGNFPSEVKHLLDRLESAKREPSRFGK